jgi:hypothetical protein
MGNEQTYVQCGVDAVHGITSSYTCNDVIDSGSGLRQFVKPSKVVGRARLSSTWTRTGGRARPMDYVVKAISGRARPLDNYVAMRGRPRKAFGFRSNCIECCMKKGSTQTEALSVVSVKRCMVTCVEVRVPGSACSRLVMVTRFGTCRLKSVV